MTTQNNHNNNKILMACVQLEWCFSRRGTLELTHNWGTESDSNFAGYHSGNSEPKGAPNIALSDLGMSFI